ncbi:WD40 repeat-like protein [Pluteus cervinus]|uniref:WD40 repeat-like protein n=1 Tax=Pluteus cervinus TaxID=181527 RepID=A0ACD3AQG5_9AGAR|nr:WD40 repeat-like protein [Pluteus cervinus]
MSFKRVSVFAANPATTRGSATKLSTHKDQLVYVNGRHVIIRDLNNATNAKTYSGHAQNATVARFSPSGYYCASADIVGNVKIWDTIGEDQTLKGEYKVISGQVNDLAWDGESKRIIAVGDGKERFGHAFMMDTGSSTGSITGHAKSLNAVSIRRDRPYRAATAGDDGLIVFHHGAPYKYDKLIKTHTKFVQDVRYSGSGDHFASVGSDYKIFLYDGKTGDTLGEIADSPHTGTIYACSWSADSRQLSTSAADRTVKLWDVETRKAVSTWNLGSAIGHQQTGNAWTDNHGIASLSLSGDLNFLDPRVSDKPSRILKAPQKAIIATTHARDSTFLTGCADGRILSSDAKTGLSDYLEGTGHSNYVSGLATSPVDGKLHSIGYDDHVREITEDAKSFVPAFTKTAAQPRSIGVAGDSTVFIAEVNGVEAFRSNQKILSHTLPGTTPTAIAASKSVVAIGGENQKVYLYDWDGKALKETTKFEGNRATISAVALSPDGKYLAAGDSSGKVVLYDVPEKKLVTSRWAFHVGRVNSISWTPDSRHCASGSLDGHVYIWSVERPIKNIGIKHAGPGGVNSVLWLNGETDGKTGKLVSAGADVCVKIWEVTFHA